MPINDVDEFDRPSISWTHKAITIANYAVDPLKNVIDTDVEFCEFTGPMTKSQLAQHITAVINDDKYEYGIYVDGMEYGEYMTTYAPTNSDAALNTTDPADFAKVMDTSNNGNFIPASTGVLTQIFVVAPEYTTNANGERVLKEDGKGQVIVSCINSHLATVTSIRNNDSGTQTVDVRYHQYYRQAGLEEGLGEPKYLETQVEVVGDFEVGDVVIIEAAETKTKTSRQIVTINHAEVVDGTVTSTKMATMQQGGSWMKIDDEQLDYAYAMRGNLDAEDNFDVDPEVGTEITAYLDNYGYVIGYTAELAEIKYLYVKDVDNGVTIASGGGGALVYLSDGTQQKINVSKIDGVAVTSALWETYMADLTTDIVTLDGTHYSADENGTNDGAEDGTPVAGTTTSYDADKVLRVFGYNELSDGSYELTTDIRTVSDPAGATRSDRAGLLEVNEYGLFHDSNAGEEDPTVAFTPTKDTMAVFSSVYFSGENGDGTPKTVSYNVQNKSYEAPLYYYIKKGTNAVMVSDGKLEQELFATNNNTVFVDIVNNKSWVGYQNGETIDDGDLNFQVVFGTNAIADVVYITNGLDTSETTEYFVVDDPESIATVDADGVKTWTYTVWLEGVETPIVARDSELKINNTVSDIDGLAMYSVYAVTKDNDGYYIEANELYNYGDLGLWVYDKAFNAKAQEKSGDKWSVAKSMSGGTLVTAWAEQWMDASTEGLLDGFTDKDATYSYDDDTKFLMMDTLTDGSYKLREASAKEVVDMNSGSTTWVDVITGDDTSGQTAYAEFIVIVKPWGEGYSWGEKDIVDTDGVAYHGLNAAGDTELVGYYNTGDTDVTKEKAVAAIYESLCAKFGESNVEVATLSAGVYTWEVTSGGAVVEYDFDTTEANDYFVPSGAVMFYLNGEKDFIDGNTQFSRTFNRPGIYDGSDTTAVNVLFMGADKKFDSFVLGTGGSDVLQSAEGTRALTSGMYVYVDVTEVVMPTSYTLSVGAFDDGKGSSTGSLAITYVPNEAALVVEEPSAATSSVYFTGGTKIAVNIVAGTEKIAGYGADASNGLAAHSLTFADVDETKADVSGVDTSKFDMTSAGVFGLGTLAGSDASANIWWEDTSFTILTEVTQAAGETPINLTSAGVSKTGSISAAPLVFLNDAWSIGYATTVAAPGISNSNNTKYTYDGDWVTLIEAAGSVSVDDEFITVSATNTAHGLLYGQTVNTGFALATDLFSIKEANDGGDASGETGMVISVSGGYTDKTTGLHYVNDSSKVTFTFTKASGQEFKTGDKFIFDTAPLGGTHAASTALTKIYGTIGGTSTIGSGLYTLNVDSDAESFSITIEGTGANLVLINGVAYQAAT